MSIRAYEWESGAGGFFKKVALYSDIEGFHITIQKWQHPEEKINTIIKEFTNKKTAINWFDRFVKMLEE